MTSSRPARTLCFLATLSSALAAGCGGEVLPAALDPETAAAHDRDGLEAASNAIISGEVDRGHDAVAMLFIDAGSNSGLCSGTMIDKRVYLTAGHCVELGNQVDYYVVGGTNLNTEDPEWVIQATTVAVHPSYDPETLDHDVGIVRLSSDAPVKPYRWLDVDQDDLYEEGTEFLAVGFGNSSGSGSGSGVKRRADLTITDVYPDFFVYEAGPDGENTCQGDSGGPAIKVIDGYLTVIGTVSFGDQGCNQLGGNMRTDVNRTFIDNYAAPDAGTAKAGGGGGGSKNPLGCSIAAASAGRSPLAAALLAGLALAGIRVRRRRA